MPRSADSRNGLHSRVLHTHAHATTITTTFSFPPLPLSQPPPPPLPFPPTITPLPSYNLSFSPASVSRSASFPLSTLCPLANLSAGTIDLRGTLVRGRIGTASRFRIRYRDPYPKNLHFGPPTGPTSKSALSVDLQIFLAST